MANDVAPFTEAELKEFLEKRTVVVVCAQPASAKSVRKLAMQFGARVDLTLLCETFEDAKKELSSRPVHLLIADLHFDKNLGLELVELQASKFPNRLEIASIMMCGDPSSSTSGMLADSDIEGVLIKPFNTENFKTVLYSSMANKVKPSPYWRLIENGKTLFNADDYEKAVTVFESAKKLDPKPALAFYYLGQIHRKKKEYTQAVQVLEDGLKLEPKDYRCLSALLDIKMEIVDYPGAYDAAIRLHADYPVSIRRILDLVKLSIYNKKYGDVVDYYEIFKQLDHKDPMITRVIIAGMLVCSKYFSLQGKKAQALEVLNNTSKIAIETLIFRIEVLRYYIETGHVREGEVYFNGLPDDIKAQRDGQIAALELMNASGQSGQLVQVGTKMIADGIHTAKVYKMMIENSKKLGRSGTNIKILEDEAKARFPEDFE